MSEPAEREQGRFESDVVARRIARIYAEALFNEAQKTNQVQTILDELRGLVHEIFRADPEIEQFFSSLAIGREAREAVLRQTFENRASPLFLNFLLVLNDHDRLELIRPILAAFLDLYEERTGRLLVRVQSAVPMPEDQLNRIGQQIRNIFHREPDLQTAVDPSLLGGFVLRVRDWLYDASVKSRVLTIRNQLIEGSTHEIQIGRDRFRDL